MLKNSLIYILKRSGGQIVKIGETTIDAETRLNDYVKRYLLDGFSIFKIFNVRYEKRKLIEKTVHEKLKDRRISGIAGSRELFECTPEIAEKIVEETIIELQPSLFVDLYNQNKLDINDIFIETRIILEFHKLNNIPFYETFEKILFVSDPTQEPLFENFEGGLINQNYLAWHENFPMKNKTINHTSNPSLLEIIEKHTLRKTFSSIYAFDDYFINKINTKLNRFERLKYKINEKLSNLKSQFEKLKNNGPQLFLLNKKLKETQKKLKILKDKENKTNIEIFAAQHEELLKKIYDITNKVRELKVLDYEREIFKNKFRFFENKSDIVFSKITLQIQKLIIEYQVIKKFNNNVNFSGLKDLKFYENFIVLFFKEFSKLFENEKKLIISKTKIIEHTLSEIYLPNKYKNKRDFIKRYISENDLDDLLKKITSDHINNFLIPKIKKNRKIRAYKKWVMQNRKEKLKRKEAHENAEKLALEKKKSWEKMSEKEKDEIKSDPIKSKYYKRIIKFKKYKKK